MVHELCDGALILIRHRRDLREVDDQLPAPHGLLLGERAREEAVGGDLVQASELDEPLDGDDADPALVPAYHGGLEPAVRFRSNVAQGPPSIPSRPAKRLPD